jgi:hypothetical protein
MKTAKITTLDKENSERFEEALLVAARTVAERFGLEIEPHGLTYSGDHTIFKLRAAIAGIDAANFVKHAEPNGLSADLLGTTINDAKHSYKIVGWEPYTRFPVMIEYEDGRRGGAKVEWIKQRLPVVSAA